MKYNKNKLFFLFLFFVIMLNGCKQINYIINHDKIKKQEEYLSLLLHKQKEINQYNNSINIAQKKALQQIENIEKNYDKKMQSLHNKDYIVISDYFSNQFTKDIKIVKDEAYFYQSKKIIDELEDLVSNYISLEKNNQSQYQYPLDQYEPNITTIDNKLKILNDSIISTSQYIDNNVIILQNNINIMDQYAVHKNSPVALRHGYNEIKKEINEICSLSTLLPLANVPNYTINNTDYICSEMNRLLKKYNKLIEDYEKDSSERNFKKIELFVQQEFSEPTIKFIGNIINLGNTLQ